MVPEKLENGPSVTLTVSPTKKGNLYKRPTKNDRNAKVVLYADDTSIIVTNHSPERLQISLNKALADIITWFRTNLLSLNFDKSYCLHFQTKHHTDIKFDIKYLNKNIASTQNVKFLGLMVDDTLS